jgi:hypothetical protein
MITLQAGRARRPIADRPSLDELAGGEVHGLSPGARIAFGPVDMVADRSGTCRFRPADHDELRCQIGLLPVAVEGDIVGEIEILPGKLTADRYAELRADLERTWLGLVRDPDAPTAVQATGPDPADIWRRLRPIVDHVLEQPRTQLERTTIAVHPERTRRISRLTPAVHRASVLGHSALVSTITAIPTPTDHALVVDTLQRLRSAAVRRPGSASVAREITRTLRHPVLSTIDLYAVTRATTSHAARHDPRYRQIAAARRLLLGSEERVTEGPGELRLGIRGLDRLYEYWVFLKVVTALVDLLGPPDPSTLDTLAVRLPGRRVRLDLPAGTTVRYGDGTEVVFEPTISANPAHSWHGLEFSQSPIPMFQVGRLTPDVVVRQPLDRSTLWVIDAKYRGRHVIDHAMVECHAKYGRIRESGAGIVRQVTVAHPHPDLRLDFAGHAAVPFVPGEPIDVLGCLPGLAHG